MRPGSLSLHWASAPLIIMRGFKSLNHLGSGPLLAATVLVMAVMLLPHLGVEVPWTARTTPHRLVHQPFIGWSLGILMGATLLLIRRGNALQQCVTALVMVGALFALAMVSALFWDAWLSPMLVSTTLPIQFAAVQSLQAQVLGQGRDGKQPAATA